MHRRHPPLPRQWLMTDERMGDALWEALEGLPRGGGIVFRHYATPSTERRLLFARVAKVARKRRLVLVRAGERPGRGEMGAHNGPRNGHAVRTASAHNRREAIAAIRQGADALFVSPVFVTRSHAAVHPLGRVRFGLLVRGLRVPVIALGGMNSARAHSLRRFGIHGWAAVDAWL